MLTDYVFVCIVHQNQGTLLLHFNWNHKTIFADPRIVYTVGILIRDLFGIHMAKVCCVRVRACSGLSLVLIGPYSILCLNSIHVMERSLMDVILR